MISYLTTRNLAGNITRFVKGIHFWETTVKEVLEQRMAINYNKGTANEPALFANESSPHKLNKKLDLKAPSVVKLYCCASTK